MGFTQGLVNGRSDTRKLKGPPKKGAFFFPVLLFQLLLKVLFSPLCSFSNFYSCEDMHPHSTLHVPCNANSVCPPCKGKRGNDVFGVFQHNR